MCAARYVRCRHCMPAVQIYYRDEDVKSKIHFEAATSEFILESYTLRKP